MLQRCIVNSLRLLAAFWIAAFTLSNLAEGATTIHGAGASFPAPLYAKWFAEYQKSHPHVLINYQSIGSGGGIRQFSQEKTVFFGASDAPMTDEQLKTAGAPVVHVPTVLGAVAITYNVPGIEKGLQLSGKVLGDIFMGKITQWSDPAIVKLNPSRKLPSLPVVVVHRSDGSGTTHIFTDYLSKVSPDWKTKVGAGTAIKWPVGLGGKGNEGVAGQVKQTPGSIGYVELVYAEKIGLAYAALQNKTGAYVLPSLEAVTASAEGALKTIPADYRVSLTDADGAKSYPVSGFTYLLVWKNMPEPVKGKSMIEFLKWAVTDGQKFAPDLQYAPLPKTLVGKIQKTLATIGTSKVN